MQQLHDRSSVTIKRPGTPKPALKMIPSKTYTLKLRTMTGIEITGEVLDRYLYIRVVPIVKVLDCRWLGTVQYHLDGVLT